MKTIKSLLCITLLIGGIFASSLLLGTKTEITTKAASNTTPPPAAINQIFPDANLAEIIRQTLNKSSVTDQVTQADLDWIKELSGGSSNIIDISGIEHLTNLNILNLADNQISDISPLANLTNLNNLYLDSNQISDISSLAPLTKLQSLYLMNNRINDISPLTNLTHLSNLYLDNNQINDINPIANLANLQFFDLTRNQISDINPLANLTNLIYISISNNQISDITPLHNLGNLQYLYLSNNQISDITPLYNLGNLQYLYLSNNQISDITPLANLANLIFFTLDSQTITLPSIQRTNDLTIENKVIDTAGSSITPTTISDGGTYNAPMIHWFNLPSTQSSVSYNFNTNITIGTFSGQVIQPLLEAYIVTYDIATNGGEGIAPESQTVLFDTLIPEPNAPAKSGHIFTGWYTAATGGDKWDFATNKMPANNITLYAQWTPINQNDSSSNNNEEPLLPQTGQNDWFILLGFFALISGAAVLFIKQKNTNKHSL
ncbi:leucine-rich repeat domain-containing protein [Culicoidibacter larvae]|uniref:LPXTG cell wall anchor domain-containing protein n=1 Tax=Culicoidibacter larvae TaxID=2579976 RepID=A0A5R8Q796_9FIRM|nr:leucine-rich repeat domain-containing protein [Culicoidibacter larvae]TLG71298.1 LPXTG cell wall anchor domain-containing protein [Culicoidibacter larvae]TLG71302.1 LPXTG cell wall anchor domain-containing protein [Culicoidibacter larvae]